MKHIDEKIEIFLKSPAFGVVGASAKPEKYGNKVMRCYQQNHRTAIPVNPTTPEIEGVACVASVTDLPEEVASISVITPPNVTEQVVERAITKGIKNIWMQPGAQSDAAVAACKQAGINIIADGSCLLVELNCH